MNEWMHESALEPQILVERALNQWHGSVPCDNLQQEFAMA